MLCAPQIPGPSVRGQAGGKEVCLLKDPAYLRTRDLPNKDQ